MEMLKGVHLEDETSKTMFKNLYELKQSVYNWYNHLVEGLLELCFTPSTVDECVFFYNSTMLLIYVDDSILSGPDE